MAKKERKQAIREILEETIKQFRAGTDKETLGLETWQTEETPHGVWLSSAVRYITEQGEVVGWAKFSVFFQWDAPLDSFRVRFHGKESIHFNRKFFIKEHIEHNLAMTLLGVCQMRDQEALYGEA